MLADSESTVQEVGQIQSCCLLCVKWNIPCLQTARWPYKCIKAGHFDILAVFCSSSKYIADSANHCHCLINVVVDLKPSSDMQKLPSAKTAKAAYSVYQYFVLILVMMLIICLMSTSFYPERQFIQTRLFCCTRLNVYIIRI